MSVSLELAAPRRETVLAAITSVDDPEYPGVSIVDLGLLERLEIRPDGSIEVGLIPTFSGCPALDVIASDVRNAVCDVADVGEVQVRWLRSPQWTPDRLSVRGRTALADAFTVAVEVAPTHGDVPTLWRGDHRGVDVRAEPLSVSPSLRVLQRDRRGDAGVIYEVFLKKDGKDEYRHAGALDAADDELAMVMARDSYVRRAEGNRIWLVRRDHVISGTAGDLGADIDRPHRHHDGQAVAARRRDLREREASS